MSTYKIIWKDISFEDENSAKYEYNYKQQAYSVLKAFLKENTKKDIKLLKIDNDTVEELDINWLLEKDEKDALSDIIAGKTTAYCETCNNYILSNDPLDNLGAGKCSLDNSFCFSFYTCKLYAETKQKQNDIKNNDVDLIQFQDTGFTYNETFYNYNSVSYIDSVRVVKRDDSIDTKIGICTTGSAKAYFCYLFDVKVADKKISIGYIYTTDLYEKVPIKNKFLQIFFGQYKYVINKKRLNMFYNIETAEMKKDKEYLTQLRETLISKLNGK